jgi:hypothetical protein
LYVTMSYPVNSILRLFNNDHTPNATAIIIKNGSIMQLKPERKMFQSVSEWHCDDELYMKVERPGLNNDFLLFKKYVHKSNLKYIPSEKDIFHKKSCQLSNMISSPMSYMTFIHWRHKFYQILKGRGSKIQTIGDADNYLQDYIKTGLGIKVNYLLYDRFKMVVNELGLTSSSLIIHLYNKVEYETRLRMLDHPVYKSLKDDVEKMKMRVLSDSPSFKYEHTQPSLYVWQNRIMKQIHINYEKKVFTITNTTTTYKTLKSAGIDKSDLFYLDIDTKNIMPIENIDTGTS